jgi:L-histidine Nalpha-methyltransferase
MHAINCPADAHALTDTLLEKFREDVLEGLHSKPKRLPSKYFYDRTGDRLFQQIMACPEYYLTNCELEIFQNKTVELAQIITSVPGASDLIELGAGDATKSQYLTVMLPVAYIAAFFIIPIAKRLAEKVTSVR